MKQLFWEKPVRAGLRFVVQQFRIRQVIRSLECLRPHFAGINESERSAWSSSGKTVLYQGTDLPCDIDFTLRLLCDNLFCAGTIWTSSQRMGLIYKMLGTDCIWRVYLTPRILALGLQMCKSWHNYCKKAQRWYYLSLLPHKEQSTFQTNCLGPPGMYSMSLLWLAALAVNGLPAWKAEPFQ